MPRLVAASLVAVLLAASCRTAIEPDPARLAALEPELGSLLLVGFRGTDVADNDDLERLFCEVRVGGIVLLARNIVDADQLARLTAALVARSAACSVTRRGFAPKLRAVPTMTGFAGL